MSGEPIRRGVFEHGSGVCMRNANVKNTRTCTRLWAYARTHIQLQAGPVCVAAINSHCDAGKSCTRKTRGREKKDTSTLMHINDDIGTPSRNLNKFNHQLYIVRRTYNIREYSIDEIKALWKLKRWRLIILRGIRTSANGKYGDTVKERFDTGDFRHRRRSASFSRPIDERFLFLPRFSHWESRYSGLKQTRKKARTNRGKKRDERIRTRVISRALWGKKQYRVII